MAPIFILHGKYNNNNNNDNNNNNKSYLQLQG